MSARAISLSLILLSGASCSDRASVFPPENGDWIATFDPIDFGDALSAKFEIRSYQIVEHDRTVDTIKELRQSSVIRIAYSEIGRYSSSLKWTGNSGPTNDQVFVLARSCFFTDHDVVHLYFNGTTLLHTVTNLGSQDVPMQKAAIVVSLPNPPDAYYFNCSLAK